jgi:hypothetical protein
MLCDMGFRIRIPKGTRSIAVSAILLCFPFLLNAQQSGDTHSIVIVDLPEAPQSQSGVSPSGSGSQATQQPPEQHPVQPGPGTPPAQTPPGQGDSGSKDSATQAAAEQSQHEKAEEQLKEQERQRIAGVMAAFNTTRNKDAVPLSPGQKFRLFFKSATDPWPFFLTGVVAGIGQAEDSNSEWGQGVQGYAKRYGAAYSDYFIGNFFGNAVLPSVLHEDPRYFQKGTGRAATRALWAAASTVWCRRDNGAWGPNYANVAGNMIGAAIARVYYPASERTVGDTIDDGLTVTVEGIVGAEVIEFWPDIARHYKRKRAEKLARQAGLRAPQTTTQPGAEQAPAPSPAKPNE